MAQTKRKRKRKHRGTAAGTVQRQGRSGPSRGKQDPKAAARQARAERLNRPPTWRGSVNRAVIAALLFGILAVAVLGRSVEQGVVLTGFMVLMYIPLGYLTDKAIYNFRQRRKAAGK